MSLIGSGVAGAGLGSAAVPTVASIVVGGATALLIGVGGTTVAQNATQPAQTTANVSKVDTPQYVN